MLFLNLLNRIFGSKNSLQREDIDGYRNKDVSNEEKQVIEEKSLSHDFDHDALEGFEKQQLNSGAMKNLDDRFTKRIKTNFNGKVITTIASLAAGVALFIWLFGLDKESRIQVAQQEVNQASTAPEENQFEQEVDASDKSEYLASGPTNENSDLNEVDQNAIKQISPVKGLGDAHEDIASAENHEELKVLGNSALAPKELFTPTPRNFTFQQQKELYMSDYKVVDYRGLREEKKLDYLTGLQEAHINNMEMLENNITENLAVTREIYYIDYLANAMYSLKHKNWSLAKKQFEDILSNYPEDVNANFYMGYLHYHNGEYELSLDFFRKSYSYNIGNFREEALWLIAQSLVQIENIEDAVELLQKIAAEGGFYADQANLLLAEIN
ncbi:MAG: tetratricopeptide repeat protein [Crocinitomicaceae bacterium]|nr:tetratricopeptide repeat protein [Crocinitomicaceae bacterium]